MIKLAGVSNLLVQVEHYWATHSYFLLLTIALFQLRDTVIIAAVNSGTSILAGFAIFAALGFMAKEQGVEVSDVAEKGQGLSFLCEFCCAVICQLFGECSLNCVSILCM